MQPISLMKNSDFSMKKNEQQGGTMATDTTTHNITHSNLIAMRHVEDFINEHSTTSTWKINMKISMA